MKKIIIILLFVTFSTTVFHAKNIQLKSTEGIVQIKSGGTGEWLTPKAGDYLNENDLIFTGFNSNAILNVENALIEIDPLTQITISSLLVEKTEIKTDVYLKYGKIKASVDTKNSDLKTYFNVRSANSTASVRGTVFIFTENGVSVEEGTVEFTTKHNNSMLIQANEKGEHKNLSSSMSPSDFKKIAYHINTLPLGLSDDEVTGLIDLIPGVNIKKDAKVIINIEVID